MLQNGHQNKSNSQNNQVVENIAPILTPALVALVENQIEGESENISALIVSEVQESEDISAIVVNQIEEATEDITALFTPALAALVVSQIEGATDDFLKKRTRAAPPITIEAIFKMKHETSKKFDPANAKPEDFARHLVPWKTVGWENRNMKRMVNLLYNWI